MKVLLALSFLVVTVSCNAESTKTLPVKKEIVAVKKEQAKAAKDAKKEEDCDDKAKKPIEIKAETISLTGNTGCSLDEVKP